MRLQRRRVVAKNAPTWGNIVDRAYQKERKKRRLAAGLIEVVLPIAFLYFIFYLVHIGCPIRFLTGVSCAGCGMTRAYMSLLHLDFASALHFHPLFFIPPVFAVYYFFFRDRVSLKMHKIIVAAVVAIFMVTYILRMFDTHDSVVVFCPKDGFIWRVIQKILN